MTSDDVFFKNWIAPLLAAFISFVFAWLIRGVDRDQRFRDKRLDHSQQTISHLSHYIENWRRLIAIAKLGQKKALTEDENSRLARYVSDRDDAKSKLVSCINMMPLFFTDEVTAEFDAFRKWDAKQSERRINELPDIREWEFWSRKLCTLLRRHIS